MTEQILGVVGWSGSGKTTLLEYLVRGLVTSGRRVNMVKHSHHDIITEPPQKDSARLRMAGASEVLLASPYRYVITSELRQDIEPPLTTLMSRLSPADITLVEGYKWESIPKLEVYRPSMARDAIYVMDTHIVAVASDVIAPDNLPSEVVWLDLNQPENVLNWLINGLQQNLFSKKIENP
ncbi:molybdopterin-guanine dinucleotide biosynthesis protein B [Undibacterium sp. SXout7W]|uniref:molybdopterin-guanine dinucleotide biosynthesis protein B n=1 Tax=Undibacterium sp. SXout7W TaxID=3413049 RepID=UPI003BEFB5F4